MHFDSVIFDIDGTLWDAVDSIAAGFSEGSLAGMKYGLERKRFTRNDILPELGKPIITIFEDLYPEVLAEFGRERAGEILIDISEASKLCEYEAIRALGGKPYEGMAETVSSIAEHIPVYIVSNCEKGYTELFLDKTGMRDIFKGWLCFGDTGLDKDRTIAMLMGNCGLKKSCYVGDIKNDALCSKRAGIPFIWASYGFGGVPEELFYRKINDIRELKDIFIG